MDILGEESEKIIFVFAGDNSINVNILVKTLSGVADAYESMVKSIDNSAELKLNVEAFNKGSFEIVFSALVENLAPMIALFQEATPTVKTFMEILKIKKDLKGKKTLSVENNDEKTKITNHMGEISYHNSNVTNLYFNNPIIDKTISDRIFTPLSLSDRETIKIVGNENQIEFDKKEYEEAANNIIDEKMTDEQFKEHESIVNVELLLRKPDLLGESMWGFKYDDQYISATIEDETFINNVKNGKIKALYHGVKIPVEMKIVATFDEKYNLVAPKKYYILSVTGDPIEPSENNDQITLDI